jgi:hypothetical protein
MSGLYHASGDPVRVLECYLDIFTSGRYSKDSNVFDSATFDIKECYLATSIKGTLPFVQHQIQFCFLLSFLQNKVSNCV